MEVEESKGKMTTIKVNGGRGKIEFFKLSPAVACKRYTGQFVSSDIQSRAYTKLWYCFARNPHVVVGEGSTPEIAARDSIARTRDLIAKMQNGLKDLEMTVS